MPKGSYKIPIDQPNELYMFRLCAAVKRLVLKPEAEANMRNHSNNKI